jgi:predicted TIM-barrel enzyme
MRPKEWELRQRAGQFARVVARICGGLPDDPAARKLGRRVSVASTAVDTGYGAACVSKSAEQFIVSISEVARQAKRARTLLLALVQANQLSIETARALILEAKALESIFAASRNTAKRRKTARGNRRSTA